MQFEKDMRKSELLLKCEARDAEGRWELCSRNAWGHVPTRHRICSALNGPSIGSYLASESHFVKLLSKYYS